MHAAGVDEAKRRMAALYSRVAPIYVEQGPPRFAYAGRRLVDITGVGPGQRVLDVATGRGAVLLAAAARVGRTGQVVGIDLAEGMVEQTRSSIAEQRLDWVDVQLMDAQHLEFVGQSFTHVLCSFAVFFFPDVPAVLAEMWRTLRPGGIVGFAFQRGVDPRWAWYEQLLRAHGALDDLPLGPGDGAIRRPGALVAALDAAGFQQTREQVEDVELGYPDAETWWASLWTHGSRAPLERLPPDRLAAVKAACLQQAHALAGPRGLEEVHRLVFVTARRPTTD
jgi:ubiquinone/menaquinone biosynthesis C-methylase UbiE